MTKPKAQPSVDWKALAKLEKKIFADERGGIMHRWEYGREVLKAKAGRKQLPDGMIADLVAAGDRNGKPISPTEIRNRIRFAEAYTYDQQVIRISVELGSWSAIIEAGFPAVEIDEEWVIGAEGVEPPDGWEQLSLLPGFKPIVKIHGREVRFDQMTVPESVAYRDKYRAMHESFGKSLDLIEATVEAILEGWDGDPEAKALDAYRRGST